VLSDDEAVDLKTGLARSACRPGFSGRTSLGTSLQQAPVSAVAHPNPAIPARIVRPGQALGRNSSMPGVSVGSACNASRSALQIGGFQTGRCNAWKDFLQLLLWQSAWGGADWAALISIVGLIHGMVQGAGSRISPSTRSMSNHLPMFVAATIQRRRHATFTLERRGRLRSAGIRCYNLRPSPPVVTTLSVEWS